MAIFKIEREKFLAEWARVQKKYYWANKRAQESGGHHAVCKASDASAEWWDLFRDGVRLGFLNRKGEILEAGAHE